MVYADMLRRSMEVKWDSLPAFGEIHHLAPPFGRLRTGAMFR